MGEVMMLHGCAFAMEDRSDARREDWRKEEDLSFAARDSLWRLVHREDHPINARFGLGTWQTRLMFFYKPVARHYGIDPDALLREFNRHYLPTLTKEAGLNPLLFT